MTAASAAAVAGVGELTEMQVGLCLVGQRESREEAVADAGLQRQFRLGDGLRVGAGLQRAGTQVGVDSGQLDPVAAVACRREGQAVRLLVALTLTAARRHQRERDVRRGQGA